MYFDWIFKLENIVAVTKQNLKKLALGKAQVAVIIFLESLLPDMSWNHVNAVLWQQFSLVPMVTDAATHPMHRYQQKWESLQEFNFNFSEHIQVVTNHEPKGIADPLKIFLYSQKLFDLTLSAKTCWACKSHIAEGL